MGGRIKSQALFVRFQGFLEVTLPCPPDFPAHSKNAQEMDISGQQGEEKGVQPASATSALPLHHYYPSTGTQPFCSVSPVVIFREGLVVRAWNLCVSSLARNSNSPALVLYLHLPWYLIFWLSQVCFCFVLFWRIKCIHSVICIEHLGFARPFAR